MLQLKVRIRSMKFPSAELLYKQRLEISLNEIVLSGLIAALLFLVVPFLFYD